MNLFKKTTATVALVALVSGIFSTGVASANSAQTDAANALAAAGYINNHSDDATAYNLNQNVLRQEIAAVARGIADLDKKSTCDNSFTDVSATTPNTWACASIEALLDADLISANTMFKPENEISKAEAVGMMVKAAFGDEYSYDAGKSTGWQEQVVAFAVENGVVAPFSNYDTAATRGFVFEAGNNAMVSSTEVVETCDEVSQLLGLCGEETTDTENEGETETPVIVNGDNVLSAELSANTAEGTDLPKSANGIEVLSFDVTAGSEDVSVSAIEVERTGFGEAAADEVAVYSEDGRVSKVKSFSSSDDTANLTFSPAVIVKAGETRTLNVKVNTASSTYGEFAVSVVNITASSTVEAASIVSNYFDVKDVVAADLEIKNEGVNVSVKAGEEQADVAEFRLTNKGISGTEVDVTVSSITLKEIGTADHEEVLENLTLTVDGNVVSTVAMMDGKYVTFNFDPIVIEDDKNETFAVKADVMGGAADKINFVLDNIADISATASKYNAVNLTGSFDGGEVLINAGELTIYAIDAESDEIRQDKTNVVLGQIKVVNVAGQNLELKNLGVALTTNAADIKTVIENVEFEVNGTSYELTNNNTGATLTFSDTDVDVNFPQGTTILTVRADTLKNLVDGTTVTMSLNAATDSTFLVQETEDDVAVGDITPSALSFDAVKVVLSGATASNVPLAGVEVVKGATDLVALQFEIEAGKASYVTADEIKVSLSASGASATKDQISEVALYQGSVSESNLLDKVSGSKLAASGSVLSVATFDGFEVEIAADSTETFIVTVSTVDTTAVVGKVIVASINDVATDIALEDDENDTVTLASASVGTKSITVKDSGKLVLSADANNTDNEDTKTILAGEEAIIYSVDAIATNEEVNVETVVFTVSEDLKQVAASAKLYLGDVVVATASNSDVLTVASGSTITFDNISDLDFATSSTELKLAIVTENIGYEKIGESISAASVIKVEVSDAEGADSSETVTVDVIDTLVNTKSNTFAVVPAKLTLSLVKNLSEGTAKVKITVNTGDNTAKLSAAAPVVTLSGLTLTNKASGGALKIFEEGESSEADFAAGIIVSSSKTFEIVPQVTTVGSAYTLAVTTNGVEYNVGTATGFTINMTSELDLGSISY